MFDFKASTPTGFHADFARCVMIPLAEAAYAVMNKPGVPPQLPPGFQMTGLIQADDPLRQAILKLPNQSIVAKAMMDDSEIFGLMGKNPATKTAFVAFRGTQTFEDWVGDFDALFEPYKYVPNGGQVHMGFQLIYGALRKSLAAGIGAAVSGCDNLLVTGHSLGGALAVTAGPDIAKNLTPSLVPELITFAGPAAGLADFARFFDLAIPSCYRVVNFWDVVPRLPPQPPIGLFEQTGTHVNVDPGFALPVEAHSLETAYVPGLLKLLPPGYTCA
ncbi:MAG: lipase family protein [Acidobacteriia bacterium]|nr:lipase family protein [Terriglobia bacterium]